jgi:beta-galactosidase
MRVQSRYLPKVRFILVCLTVSALISCSSLAKAGRTEVRERTLLDSDWMFHAGDVSSNDQNQVTSPGYDDRQWKRIDVPHDYGLDAAYNPTNSRRNGYLPMDVAWYRKRFVIPKSDEGKILHLEFGGIFRDSRVWLNGQFLGRHASGYTGFFYDISKAARYGAENVIAVSVDPREREGWWYEGAGIYRHVHLDAMSPLHVTPFGTYVKSEVRDGDKGGQEGAEISIQTTIVNEGTASTNCRVVSEIFAPDGSSFKPIETSQTVSAGEQRETVQRTKIRRPRLWSIESPQLYELRTTVVQSGRPVDSTTTTFGIRTIRFDADKGFFLNGKHVKIYGVANHQDFPAVGIAVPDSLQPWRVEQLKRMGCNGWRTAHNPPNEEVLDACDRLGMLVMDENRHLGDTWLDKTLPGSSHTNLEDLAWMVQRDRNHPSIIMWSMCNEEKQMQGVPEGAKIFSAMKEVVHRYDKTRPVTSAMHGGWMGAGFTTVEDLIGVNYHPTEYDEIHKTNPRLPMYGSETANTKTTRGVYENDATNGWASAYNMFDENVGNKFSPGICKNGWPAVASRAFVSGSFTWTGFDYKGEPNPYGWPDISNNTGLMDVCGFPKDKYYYLQSCWSEKPMVHLLPMRWTWPGKEGKAIRVVAFSNAREVELILNGKSLGSKTMPRDGYVESKVSYEPGRLVAEAKTDGRIVATDQVETAGPPARIQLSSERQKLRADGQDTVVVPVSILDAGGHLVPDADNRVTFELAGGGRILGVGNGNPSDHDSDRSNQRRAFNGRCIVIVQARALPEVFQLTASSPGLKPASLSFRVR